MPKLPENYVSYRKPDGTQAAGYRGRQDFKTVHPLLDEGEDRSHLPVTMVSNATSLGMAVEQDILGKKLFLNTLTDMIVQEGGKTNAEEAFREIAHLVIGRPKKYSLTSLDGSQVVCSLHDFKPTPFHAKQWTGLGPPESTTRFGFQFRSPQLATFDVTEQARQGINTSYYQLDATPFRLFEKLGAPTALKQRYLQGFMKMAEMAEHDYLHQMITFTRDAADWYFPDEMGQTGSSYKLYDLEKLTLGGHAQICHRLFGAHLLHEPHLTEAQQQALQVGQRRKQKVLDWAKDVFETIVEMQRIAMAKATPSGQAEVKEAVTYLAEIYAHRLFRVISPTDPDLVRSGIADICEQLTLKMPPKKGKPQKDQHGIEGLRALCGTYMGDLYVQSHEMTTAKIITRVTDINHVLQERGHQMMTPAQFIDGAAQLGLPKMKARWEDRTGKHFEAYMQAQAQTSTTEIER